MDGFSFISKERIVQVPEQDVDSLGYSAYGVWDMQVLDFYPDSSLRRVMLSFDENNNLFYYKDSLGNVTFELSPNFEYTDESKYSSEATGLD